MAQTLLEKRSDALAELPEWQKLLEHFELADDSFAYIPLLVPDNSWAEVCEKSLTVFLAAKKKKLRKLVFTKPADFKNLAVKLFDLKFTKNTAAIWITAPIVFRDTQIETWQEAWREATARLNQFRNPLREKFPVTFIFVGGFWSQQITRTMAPDLWSIRTTVVRIEPPTVISDSATRTGSIETRAAGEVITLKKPFGTDPYFALKEAEKLRGKKGQEETLVEILSRAVIGFLDRGKYQEALEVSEEIESILKPLLVHQKTNELEELYALTLSEKGVALEYLGRYDEAVELFKQALLINEKTIGKEHPYYAIDLNNLANVYESQGRYDEAVELFKQALLIDEKTIGKEHPYYAVDLNNLALVYESQGRYDEAVELFKQALLIDEKTIGKQHPSYAVHLNNLALVYHSQGKYDEAVELYQQAQEIDEKTIGKQHPSYAIRLGNLASVYEHQGKYREALALYEQVLLIDEKTLPENHPYTIQDRESVARCRKMLEGGEEDF